MSVGSFNPDVKELEATLSKFGVTISNYTAILDKPSRMTLAFPPEATETISNSLACHTLDEYSQQALSMANAETNGSLPLGKADVRVVSADPYIIEIQASLIVVKYFVYILLPHKFSH